MAAGSEREPGRAGGGWSGDAWYEPQSRAPLWQGGASASAQASDDGARSDRARARDQLSDVADALQRLMDVPATTTEAAAPNRQARRAAAARARGERGTSERQPAPSAAPVPADARTSRIEAVLKALDRLDRRVEDLSHAAPAQDHAPQSPRETDSRERFGRYQPAASSDAGYADGYAEGSALGGYEDDRRSADRYYAEGRYSDVRSGYADTRPGDDGRYAPSRDAAGQGRAHEMSPRERADRDGDDRYGGGYGYGRADAAFAPSRPREAGDLASDLGAGLRPLFQDLSRQIDAARAPQEEALGVMREDIGALRAVLMDSLANDRNRAAPRDTGELRRLSDAVERMRADRSDLRLARELRAEIGDLRALIGQSNVDGMLKSLESGYAHLVQRLDELARGQADPQLVDTLSLRLGDIEGALRIVPRADQLMALDDRVADIGHRVEELVRRSGGEGLGSLKAEIRAVREVVEQIDVRDLIGGIDERLHALSDRFDALDRLAEDQRNIFHRLDAMEDRVPSAGTFDRLQDRLEQISGMLFEDRAAREAGPDPRLDERLGEIAGRLQRIESARQMPPSYDAAFTLLEKRLMAIDGKIDAMERPQQVTLAAEGQQAAIEADLIARLEAGITRLNDRFERSSDTGPGAPELEALHREIADLRDSVSRPALSADLEAQLRDLAQAVGRGAVSDDASVLAQVEDKIAALAGKLDAAESGFARLDQVQSQLAGLGVSGAGGDQNAAIADALRADLHRLMDAATSSEQRTRDTMDSVQDILASINARLSALEDPMGEAGSVRAGVLQDDDRPLEPGSGKPAPRGKPQARARMEMPLAASVRGSTRGDEARRAAQQAAGDGSGKDARDRKADFIAAARRAAQAASAQAVEPKTASRAEGDESGGTVKATAAGWLRSRLAGRRKAAAGEEPGAATPEPRVDGDTGGERRSGSRKASTAAPLRVDPAMEDLRAEPRIKDAEASADTADDTAKSGRSLFSPGGRRAVMLAAAAVVIAIGALQIFKQTGPGASDPVAGDAPAVAERTIEGEAVETARAGSVAETGGQDAGTAPPSRQAKAADKTPAANGPVRAGATTAPASAAVGPEAAAPQTRQASAASDPAQGTPESLANLGTPGVAFAPPGAAGGAFAPELDSIPVNRFQARAPAVDISNLPTEVGSVALRQAAAAGDPAANFAIAVHYTEGNSVKPDLAKAAEYYEKAARAGLAPAQYRLGSLYEKGRGVARDLAKAREWYGRAAEAGNAKAAHNLAVLYAEGLSGEPEFRDAAYWFKKAANFGLADSQYNLGILYARGLGLEKNLVESYKWFALAAQQGDRDAGNKRDELANMLSKEELAEARLAVETWKPAARTPAANEVEMKPAWDTPAETVSRANLTMDPAALVRQAQELLIKRGFDPGTADGRVGPRTREAVRAFQMTAGLPVTGEIDAALLKALAAQAI
ncbi:SEL1-like repeat protein [Stappia taiwanensis]|uniref:SEL1-like repeat protein n=1 Tax=Stappia taiwanensis TaxID=992267 RepID=A0A838XYN9_9HYPH|nr:peptidoglycan-binding protein [Stappia taiwanensis]MBA4612144.1 SEL1-like repeat protein [Stappia taiwanensis]GGE93290.1 peptidoglycan-binding protein [Stappia taiwanensis]